MYQFEFHLRPGIVLSAVVRIANIISTTVVRIVVGYTGIFQSASLDHPDRLIVPRLTIRIVDKSV